MSTGNAFRTTYYLENVNCSIEYSTTEILTWTKVYILAIVVDKLHLQSKSSQGYSWELRTRIQNLIHHAYEWILED